MSTAARESVRLESPPLEQHGPAQSHRSCRVPESLRILHVMPALAPRYGGPTEAVLQMCHAVRSRGVETTIVATDADGPGHLPVATGELIDYQGARTRFFPRQWSEAFKYSRPLARWLGSHVQEFDVVHVHAVFSHAALAGAAAARRARVPYIVRPLGSLSPWGLRRRRVLKQLLWHAGVGRMLRGASTIHCTSPAEQQHADAVVGRAAGVVVPLGVDLPALDRPEAGCLPRADLAMDRDPYVLVLGRLHPVKGLEPLVSAFLELLRRQSLADWRLKIAGDGDPAYVARLESLCRTPGERERILFTGWVEGEAKAALLRNAALLAMPSHQESFGLAAFEALAHGVPVLVSSCVDLAAEIQEAQAGWVAELSPGGLQTALAEALGHAGERAARGARGRALVADRYTWPAVAQRLVELYRQVSRAGGAK